MLRSMRLVSFRCAALTAATLALAACEPGAAPDDGAGLPDPTDTDAPPSDSSDPTEGHDTGSADDCVGEACDLPGMTFALRPDRSRVTRSHIVWHPVEGAVSYEVTMQAPGRADPRYHRATEGTRAQIPTDLRESGDLIITVKAMDAEGDPVAESDVIRPAPTGDLPGGGICHAHCANGRGYSYTLTVGGHPVTGANSQIQIMRGIGSSAYTHAQWLAINPGAQGRAWSKVELDNASSAGSVVRNAQCAELTGTVYFIEDDGGAWEYAIQEMMSTQMAGADGFQTCSDYPTLSGLRQQFNSYSAISPNLSCAEPCYDSDPDDYVDDDPSGWPFVSWEDGVLTHEIPWGSVFPDSGNGGNPGPGPGWLDDERLADYLHHLADRLHDGVESEVDAGWHLEAVSLRPVGATDPDDQIDIAPDDLRRWGSGALGEVTPQLQDGELYLLTQYFGATRVYPQVMVHHAPED